MSIPSQDEPLTNWPVAVKVIALPQDVPSTSDRRLIELENQVQRLMEAHLAPTQPTQVNKITTPCEICSGPHDTYVCIEDPEQACVKYASSRTNEMGSKRFTPNQGPRSFNDATNTWKEKPNFNWAYTHTFTSPQGGSISIHSSRTQLEQQQDDMNGKINLLWKTISEKLNNVSTLKNAGNPIAPKNIAAISHDEREELRKKGIKSPSKLLSLKYLSPASIKELNKNPSAPKRVHFVNSIVILSTDSDTEEDDSSTNERDLNLDGVIKGKEEVKEEDKKENEIETDMEVDGEIEEEESKFETDEEVEEIIEEEEDKEDGENFNSFPTMEELTHHEWLLKNPRPPWVKARIRAGNPNNIKISCMIGHFFKRHAYIDLESPINIMKNKRPKYFHRKFCLRYDFMILEDTTSIIDHHLEEMVFERPFIKETGIAYNENEGAVMFNQDDEKITFKMPHTVEIFKQTKLMGLGTDFIPSSAHEENLAME
ncbi:hypothetical protein Tco_0432460 [Tanacetum coccineum]